MLLDLGIMGAFLVFGNWKFRHFDPFLPLWKRLVKSGVTLAVTAVFSYYFGTPGVLVGLGAAMVPLIYVHGFWLPKNGVNGWTGEPKNKYWALRGWTNRDGVESEKG